MNQFDATFLDPISGTVAATAKWDDSFEELTIVLASGPLPTLRPFSAIEGVGLGSFTPSGHLNIRADRSSGTPVFHIELAGRTLVRQTTLSASTAPSSSLVWTQPGAAVLPPTMPPTPSMPQLASMPPAPQFSPQFSPQFAPNAHGPITYGQAQQAKKSSTKKYVLIGLAGVVAVSLAIGAAALFVRGRNQETPIKASFDSVTETTVLINPGVNLDLDPEAGSGQPALSLPLPTLDERLVEVANEYVGAANPEAVAACVKQT